MIFVSELIYKLFNEQTYTFYYNKVEAVEQGPVIFCHLQERKGDSLKEHIRMGLSLLLHTLA